MRTVLAAGGIILNNKNQIALVSQFGEEWVFPKGKIDEGEDVLECAKREITEETGLTDLQLIKKLGTYEHISQGPRQLNNERIFKIVHMYLFKTNQTELNPQDDHNPDAIWVDIEKAQDYLQKHAQTKFFLSIKNTLL